MLIIYYETATFQNIADQSARHSMHESLYLFTPFSYSEVKCFSKRMLLKNSSQQQVVH